MKRELIIRLKKPKGTTKRYLYSSDEAREIVKDLRKRYSGATVKVLPSKKRRGRTVRKYKRGKSFS